MRVRGEDNNKRKRQNKTKQKSTQLRVINAQYLVLGWEGERIKKSKSESESKKSVRMRIEIEIEQSVCRFFEKNNFFVS